MFCHGKLVSYLTPCLNRSVVPQEPESPNLNSFRSSHLLPYIPCCIASTMGKLYANFTSVLFTNEKGSDPAGVSKRQRKHGNVRLTASAKNSLVQCTKLFCHPQYHFVATFRATFFLQTDTEYLLLSITAHKLFDNCSLVSNSDYAFPGVA